MKPVQAVPLIGVEVRALDVATSEGSRLASTAARTLTTADIQRVRLIDGHVDLNAVRSMQQPLADAAQTVADVQQAVDDVPVDWLVPQVGSRFVDLKREVTKAADDTQLASQGAELLPDLLGARAPRHYLVLFTTPAESRNLGGFVGDYAELTANAGHVEMTRSGEVAELNDYSAPDKKLMGLSDYINAYGSSRPGRYFQNVTASPTFPDVGAAAAQLYPQAPGGQPIDGVIVVDPEALASILGVTGPVTVPGFDQPLTKANAIDLLTREQYLQFGNNEPTDQQVRYDFLHEATRATFEALTTSTTMPAPNTLANLFGPVVGGGRLLAFSLHDREESLLTRIGMDGTFPSANGGDLLGVFESNTGPNKLDSYLHRDIDKHVTYDPSTGSVDSTVTVALTNEAPLDGLPYEVGANDDGQPFGTNETQVRLYSPLSISSATSSETPLPISIQNEFGMHSYTAALDVPAGQTVTIQLHLSGRISPGPYRLTLAHQPLVNEDTIHLTVEGTKRWTPQPLPGWIVVPDSATTTLTSTGSESFAVRFRN
jgi:hypothetical protein